MSIKNIIDLKKNPLISALNYQQSEYDNNDETILNNNFTRSPIHAIAFLIAYAGLNEEQKNTVLQNLDNKKITKNDLDNLLLNIDWPSVLTSFDKNSPLDFKLTIKLANTNAYLNAVADKCPLLHQALMQNNCMVTIGESDRVIFTTTISQDEEWLEPFKNENFFWEVPKFELSEVLKKKIQALADNETITIGSFDITKGSNWEKDDIKLRIIVPQNSDEFSLKNDLEVNPGIYNAFLGITEFYGLPSVDEVKVYLKSEARFNPKGASAAQTQEVHCINKSLSWGSPTYITVKNVCALFKGADLVANFDKPNINSIFDQNIYIDLPTKSKIGTGVSLLASMPTPKEAFLLYSEAAQALNLIKKSPTVKTLFSQINIPSSKLIQTELNDGLKFN